MFRWKSLFYLLLLGLFILQPLNFVSSQTSSQVPWLHTSTTNVYDENGGRVHLFGINVVYGAGEKIALADIENAKQLGFTAVRFLIYWGLIQPFNDSLSGIAESFFTGGKYPLSIGLDQLVNWTVQERMYIILCMSWTQSWPPPNWAFPNLPDDSQRYTDLITGSASKERIGFVNAWKYVANRYKDTPNVLFEILNEPNVLDNSLAGSPYGAFNEQVISAIESVETQSHLKLIQLLIGTYPWQEITTGASDVKSQNVVWATHHYAPLVSFDPNGSYWHGAFTWHQEYFPEGWGNGTLYVVWRTSRDADKIQAWNRPWMATEFSKPVTQENWQAWYNTTLQTMASYNISGWMFYCYTSDPSKEIGWNINNPATQSQVMPVLERYIPIPEINMPTFLLILILPALLISLRRRHAV